MQITVYTLTYDNDSGLGTSVYATKAERDADLIQALRSYDVDVADDFDPVTHDWPAGCEDIDARFDVDSHVIFIPHAIHVA